MYIHYLKFQKSRGVVGRDNEQTNKTLSHNLLLNLKIWHSNEFMLYISCIMMYVYDVLCKDVLLQYLQALNHPQKCSVQNLMFRFTQMENLNLHSGSCSMIWLNQTLNIMLGSGSNIVHNVQNLTVASLSTQALKHSSSSPALKIFGWQIKIGLCWHASALVCQCLREIWTQTPTQKANPGEYLGWFSCAWNWVQTQTSTM